MVTIQLNGDACELPDGTTVAALLTRLEIDPRRVAVEHNFAVLKRERYAATTIAAGDQIEIVNFVGGG